MKKFTLYVLASALSFFVLDIQATQSILETVQASGRALIQKDNAEEAYEEAITMAKRKVLRRAVKTRMLASDRAKFEMVLEKRIYSNAQHFINEDSEVIERKNSKNFVTVKLSVNVLKDKLESHLNDIRKLAEKAQTRYIGFYISEANREASLGEDALVKVFRANADFNVASLPMAKENAASDIEILECVEALKGGSETELNEKQSEIVMRLGAELHIDFLIFGESKMGVLPKELKAFDESSVSLYLCVYDCGNGKLVKTWKGAVRGGGISKQDAEKDAYHKITVKAFSELSPEVYNAIASAK